MQSLDCPNCGNDRFAKNMTGWQEGTVVSWESGNVHFAGSSCHPEEYEPEVICRSCSREWLIRDGELVHPDAGSLTDDDLATDGGTVDVTTLEAGDRFQYDGGRVFTIADVDDGLLELENGTVVAVDDVQRDFDDDTCRLLDDDERDCEGCGRVRRVEHLEENDTGMLVCAGCRDFNPAMTDGGIPSKSSSGLECPSCDARDWNTDGRLTCRECGYTPRASVRESIRASMEEREA